MQTGRRRSRSDESLIKELWRKHNSPLGEAVEQPSKSLIDKTSVGLPLWAGLNDDSNNILS